MLQVATQVLLGNGTKVRSVASHGCMWAADASMHCCVNSSSSESSMRLFVIQLLRGVKKAGPVYFVAMAGPHINTIQ